MRSTGIFLSLTVIVTVISAEYCDYRETVAGYFYCSGLSGDSGDYVKEALANLSLSANSNISVYINASDLSSLPADLFDGYNVLYFESCYSSMTTMPFDAMVSFGPLLQQIDIYYCNITSVERYTAQNLPFSGSLYYINLAFNRISKIGEMAFVDFTAMEYLYIDVNDGIEVVEDYAFAGIVNLVHLEFHNNTNIYIPSHAFNDLRNLTYLSIHDNGLKTMENGTISDEILPSLTQLNIEGNPWYCNCSLEWLKDYINDHPDLYMEANPQCDQPKVANFSDVDFCLW